VPKNYKRADRMGKLMLETISEIVRQMSENETEFITVNDVKLTDDLLSCRVFYSVLGSDEDKEKAKKFFNKNAKEIRYRLSSSIDLRRTPSLSFDYDFTNERASKIYDILEKIENEQQS
jgi:ribosome-binding factor A